MDQHDVADLERWRGQKDAELRAEEGWLALAGLFWLKEGQNSFGSDPDGEIVLPAGSAPDYAGSFEFYNGVTTIHVADGIAMTVDGQPAGSARLRADSDGAPERIALGNLTMLIIKRGARYGVRVWDRGSPARTSFTGRRWFPPRESYTIAAAFVAYEPPKPLAVANILGDTESMPSPGYAMFTLDGQECRLDALPDPSGLAFYFRDATTGDTTYPIGRYLKAALPQDGWVTLDFNRAYSPPCAFTVFATCTLPPPQNHLPLLIEAGELYEHL
jgi:uncharacterized protein (DUF1684 family)